LGRLLEIAKAAVLGELADRTMTLAELSAYWRVEFEERAAIREYDGGQAREHAEAEALREIVERKRAADEKTKKG